MLERQHDAPRVPSSEAGQNKFANTFSRLMEDFNSAYYTSAPSERNLSLEGLPKRVLTAAELRLHDHKHQLSQEWEKHDGSQSLDKLSKAKILRIIALELITRYGFIDYSVFCKTSREQISGVSLSDLTKTYRDLDRSIKDCFPGWFSIQEG